MRWEIDPFEHSPADRAKRVIFTILGVLAGSVLAWGGLLAWASLNLHEQDSLFDRDPQALHLKLASECCVVPSKKHFGRGLSRRSFQRHRRRVFCLFSAKYSFDLSFFS